MVEYLRWSFFERIVNGFLAVTYFLKSLHCRCLTGFLRFLTLRCYKGVYVKSLFLHTARFWNSLLAIFFFFFCLRCKYGFKSRVKRYFWSLDFFLSTLLNVFVLRLFIFLASTYFAVVFWPWVDGGSTKKKVDYDYLK